MLIWGSHSYSIKLGSPTKPNCKKCGALASCDLQLNYSCGHLWYIFSWVKSKTYFLCCSSCLNIEKLDATTIENQLPAPVIPWLHRRGWTLFVALIAVVFLVSTVQSKLKYISDQDLMNHPQIGDQYVFDFKEIQKAEGSAHFGVLKISKIINSHEIEFVLSKTVSTKSLGPIQDISAGYTEAENYFSNEVVVLDQEKLQSFRDKNIIIEINRSSAARARAAK